MNRKDSRIVNFLESPIVYTIVIVTSFQIKNRILLTI